MIGRIVSHYRILQKLGGGGMGVVYKAEDLKLRRTVALKFLAPELTRDEDAKKRFLHEAQAASALDHPNICGIYEIDETPEGQLFIAMTCYDGESLKEWIARGSLDVIQAFQIAFAVAQGLGRAHSSNIVHRDIKPANVMITKDGFVKIIDFGLSKLVGRSSVTRSGTTLGTVAYMSPEQARGDDVDARADIWALGVILYEMLTSRLPFRGENGHAMIYSILNEEPAPLRSLRPSVPDACEALVMKCLAKHSTERYQSAGEFCAAVSETGRKLGWRDAFVSGGGQVVRVPPGGLRRPQTRLSIAAVAVVVVAVAGFVMRDRFMPVYSTEIRLAVVPFERIGSVPSQAAAEGVSRWVSLEAETASRLHRSMWVIPYERVRTEGPVSADRMSAVLGVNRILTGEFQPFGAKTQLTLRLLDADKMVPVRTAVVDLQPDSFDGMLESTSAVVADLFDLSDPRAAQANPAGAAPPAPGVYTFMEGIGHLVHYQVGDNTEQAVARLEGAVTLAPHFAPARSALATALYRMHSRGRDADLLQRAEEQIRASIALDSTSAGSQVILSRVLRGLGRTEEAEEACRNAIAIDRAHIQAYDELFALLIHGDRYDEAIEVCEALARHRPDYYRIHWNLAWLYRRMGRTQEELRENLLASRLAPDNQNILNSLGVYYFNAGDFSRAREYWQRAYMAGPPACASSSNLGSALYYEGRFEESAKFHEHALELCPSDEDEYWGNWAASLYWTEGKGDRALEAFAKAAELALVRVQQNPDDGKTIGRLADYYAMMGRADEALATIDRAARFDDPEVHFRVAMAYEALGERGKALDHVTRAVQGKYPLDAIEREPMLRNLVKDEAFKIIRKSVSSAGK